MAGGSHVGIRGADLGNGGTRRVVLDHMDHIGSLVENWHIVVDVTNV